MTEEEARQAVDEANAWRAEAWKETARLEKENLELRAILGDLYNNEFMVDEEIEIRIRQFLGLPLGDEGCENE